MYPPSSHQKLSIKSNSQSINFKDLRSFSKIFNESVNITIWKRKLDISIQQAAEEILLKDPNFKISLVPQSHEIEKSLFSELGSSKNILALIRDITKLAKLFCDLFEMDRAWIRLDAIKKPMCPRFHTDSLKCRLVTTYVGPATEWLSNDVVDRSKLGSGNNGLPDNESGLFKSNADINQLATGDVALLKGNGWKGNEGAGIVHRSPHSNDDYKRLYMTIDFQELFLKIYQQNKRFAMSN